MRTFAFDIKAPKKFSTFTKDHVLIADSSFKRPDRFLHIVNRGKARKLIDQYALIYGIHIAKDGFYVMKW